MTRTGWAALAAALVVAEAVAVIAGQWIAVGVLASALTGLAALRTGWRWAWRVAGRHYRRDMASVFEQLRRIEAHEADIGETEHARIRDGGPWTDNGAGYRSRLTTDSPADRPGEVAQHHHLAPMKGNS